MGIIRHRHHNPNLVCHNVVIVAVDVDVDVVAVAVVAAVVDVVAAAASAVHVGSPCMAASSISSLPPNSSCQTLLPSCSPPPPTALLPLASAHVDVLPAANPTPRERIQSQEIEIWMHG